MSESAALPPPSVAPSGASLTLLARLGAALAAPERLAGRAALARALAERGGGALPEAAAAAMLEAPAFAPHLIRLARAALAGADCSAALVGRLADSPRARLAAALLSAEDDALDEAAELVAAAAMQRRFLGAVTRARREALAAAFGAPARALGSGEAPLLYAALAELDDDAPAASPASVRAAGRAILSALVAHLEPELGPAFALRAGPAAPPAAFAERHVAPLEKLIRRKCPQWRPLVS